MSKNDLVMSSYNCEPVQNGAYLVYITGKFCQTRVPCVAMHKNNKWYTLNIWNTGYGEHQLSANQITHVCKLPENLLDEWEVTASA